jgi:uncharacterized glyoxalase superfamily protein PhnB
VPRLTRQATVLLVEDVARSLDYYRDALGFDVDVYAPLPEDYGFARRDDCYVHLARSQTRRAGAVDLFDAYFYVDDVDELHAELAERGADVVQEPVEQNYGLRELRVRDPDGYVLAFGQVP